MRHLLATLSLALCLALAPAAAAREGPLTLTVVPFASADAGQDVWLGKAVADLLSRKLAEAPGLAVLDRERLQRYLDEMELQAGGFFGAAEAGRLGRVAKVEQVVYGNFRRQGEAISIKLLLVDLASQRGIVSAQAEGALDALHGLVAGLAQQVLSHAGVTPSLELERRIRFRPTDSLAATEHFYKAVDHLDHGRLEEAFGAFFAATRQDSDFLEAKLWMGRVLQALGRDALAVAAFAELAAHPGLPVEKLDALMFRAGLLEADDPEAAIADYRGLMTLKPVRPQSLEAAFRLGLLLARRGEAAGAYDAFALVDAFRAALQERLDLGQSKLRAMTPAELSALLLEQARRELWAPPAAAALSPASVDGARDVGPRGSRFFGWAHALGLYREAVLKMAQLLPVLPAGQTPLPRGVFLLAPDDNAVLEESYGVRPSLFHEEDYGPNWREKFYVIALPEGYLATGVEIEVSGRTFEKSQGVSYAMRLLPFPWPANYHNAWLGVIYGQNERPTTLRKVINFHGQVQPALALQFIENHSEIRSWRLKVKLRRAEAAAVTAVPEEASGERLSGGFWEGEAVGRVPARAVPSAAPAALPLFAYLQQPRRSLALANSHLDGLHLVTVSGAPGGEPTDLWWSRSRDGADWTPQVRLPVNAASEDYDPRLLRGEAGGLRLFWLSDRRGAGWEIWTSARAKEMPGQAPPQWQAPLRVPLESSDAAASARPNGAPHALPEYAVAQDRRGRWLLAVAQAGARDISLMRSEDGERWRSLTVLTASKTIRSLVLQVDRGGRILLGGSTEDGRFRLWRSNDFTRWQNVEVGGAGEANGWGRPRSYPSYLFVEASGALLLLTSDQLYGLRYARFDQTGGALQRDLVKDAGLEAYAATALGDGAYLVALAQGDGAVLRRYRRFQSPDNGENPPGGRIYTETETDLDGNRWHRTFARHRIIAPDVTALAVAEDGRVWWGIESGVMSANKEDFFFQDVAGGFFTHALSGIATCGETTYFAALEGARDRLALARPSRAITTVLGWRSDYRVEVVALPEWAGDVTAMACVNAAGGGAGGLAVGTSRGALLILRGHRVLRRLRVAQGAAVTAVVAGGRGLYAGTAEGELFRIGDGQTQQLALPAGDGAVTALTVDSKGRLWMAREGQGLWRQSAEGWLSLAERLPAFPYRSIAALHADPKEGVWVLPGPGVTSVGLARVTDAAFQLYNPPSRRLARPVDFDLAPNGDLWIATALNGFYRLEWATP